MLDIENLNLTQQRDEKHIPTSIREVERVELSQSKARREPGILGVLFKFQPDFLYLD